MTSALFRPALQPAAALGLILALAAAAAAQTQVKTAQGTVEGTVAANNAVRVFRGIPYAAPPVGDLRWKAPQPAASWTGVRKADAFGARRRASSSA